jgi:hypothetical protein
MSQVLCFDKSKLHSLHPYKKISVDFSPEMPVKEIPLFVGSQITGVP